MPLTAGTRLATYEIVALLGAGGMGEVYRARDARLGRDVALKVLPADVASHPERLARFEREARTVAALNHPSIVTLFTVEDADGFRFLTMELVEGQGLDQQVTPGGLPVARVVDLGITIADALSAAHEKGVVHRDLKPANVMLTREGRVKVLDFGLAKPVGEDAPGGSDASDSATVSTPLSGVGQLLGTLPYMAPEQLRGHAVDARTDLFALGVVLYELAAGRRPFAGDSPVDVSSAILRDTPTPLRLSRPELPADFERLVARCLAKAPRERPASALEVCHELRRLRRAVEQGAVASAAAAAPERLASIAVLPFANRSADPGDEYFSDGLADELINVLARIRGLRVVARTSSFQFRGGREDLATIGARLDVSTVLDGSVRKAGDRVRISVQLLNVADSSHLWSETYDRTLDDIFAVQDDIAQSVVKELRTTLLGEAADSDASGAARVDVARAARGRGADPESQRLYLLARHLVDRRTREDTASAVGYLRQALERDPEFALAWAELAWAYARQADAGWAGVADAYARARDAVSRALAVEPNLAEAHAQRGNIQLSFEQDWRGADASLRRALELDSGNQSALRRAGVLALALGRLDGAIAHFRRALELDPLGANTYHSLGRALYYAGRSDDAALAFRKALELTPQRIVTRAMLALALLRQGQGGEALEEARREPDDALRLWSVAILQHALGREAEATGALRELIERFAGDAAFQVAEIHGARREHDAAFQWLERAHAQQDRGLVELLSTPHLRPLHGDPRWSAFVEKRGLRA